MRTFSCNRYFVQQEEFSLSELISEGVSFATLEEAKEFIKKTDPEEKFAYNVYKIIANVEYSV